MSKLTRQERADLRQFLVESFNLSELKTLSFDLGVDYESLPHETKNEFARELLAYFERKDNVSCLVTEVIRQRPNDELVAVLAHLQSCSPRTKVQIVLSNDQLVSKPNLLGELAKLLGVAPDEVMLIGTAAGSIKVLISLPKEAADRLLDSPPKVIGGYYQVISVTSFDQLPNPAQQNWRQAALEGSPGGAGVVAAGGAVAVTGQGFPIGLVALLLIIVGAIVLVVIVGGVTVIATWPRIAIENRCRVAHRVEVEEFLSEVGLELSDLPGILRGIRQIELPAGETQTWPILHGDYVFKYDGTSVLIIVPGFDQFDPITVNPKFDISFEGIVVLSAEDSLLAPVRIDEKAGFGSRYSVVLCSNEPE